MAEDTCISDLPLDVIKVMISFLPLKDVSSISCSSSLWKRESLCVDSVIVDFDDLSELKARQLIQFLHKLLIKRGDKKFDQFSIKCESRAIQRDVLSMVNSCLNEHVSTNLLLQIGYVQRENVDFNSRWVKEIEKMSLRFLSTKLNELGFDSLQTMDLYAVKFSDSKLSVGEYFPRLTHLIVEDCINLKTIVVVSAGLKRFLFRDSEINDDLVNVKVWCSQLERLSVIIKSPSLERKISIVCKELGYLYLEGFIECHEFHLDCLNLVIMEANLALSPRSIYSHDLEEETCLENFCKKLFCGIRTTHLSLGADCIQSLLDVEIEMPEVEALVLNIQTFWQDEVIDLCSLLPLVPTVSVLKINRTHSWRKISTVRRIRQRSADLWKYRMLENLKVLKIEWINNDECMDYKVKAESKVRAFIGVILNRAKALKNLQILVKAPCVVEDVELILADYEGLYTHVLFEYIYI